MGLRCDHNRPSPGGWCAVLLIEGGRQVSERADLSKRGEGSRLWPLHEKGGCGLDLLCPSCASKKVTCFVAKIYGNVKTLPLRRLQISSIQQTFRTRLVSSLQYSWWFGGFAWSSLLIVCLRRLLQWRSVCAQFLHSTTCLVLHGCIALLSHDLLSCGFMSMNMRSAQAYHEEE